MAFIPSFFRSIRLLYSLWWAIWIVLYSYIIHDLGYAWNIAWCDSLISNGILILICLVIGNILLYYQPSKNTAWKLIFWCLLAAAFWSGLAQWVLSKWISDDLDYISDVSHTLPIRFAIGFLTIGCTVLITWIWEFIAFKNEDAERQAKAISLAKDAELAGLTQQLQPHFLFNSLNSISALVVNRPDEARIMIQQLSDFLRGTLKKDNKQLTWLSEELGHLQLYLNIEKVRFGHRLSTVINCDEISLDLKLPALILQPILENAIKFGLYDTIDEVEIKIESKVENKMLILTVQNPFDPTTSINSRGTGFGFKSVSRRLFLIYGRNDLLKTTTTEDTFTTTVHFPQII